MVRKVFKDSFFSSVSQSTSQRVIELAAIIIVTFNGLFSNLLLLSEISRPLYGFCKIIFSKIL